jgi:hypothetical protein
MLNSLRLLCALCASAVNFYVTYAQLITSRRYDTQRLGFIMIYWSDPCRMMMSV